MRRCIFIIIVMGFMWECTRSPDEFAIETSGEEMTLSSWGGIPPQGVRDFLDSFRFAFEYIQTTFEWESGYSNEYYDNQGEQAEPLVLKINLTQLVREFYIKKEKIREYDWNGFLLIALHEWYHIQYGGSSNDEDHERMKVDDIYHRWIQIIFGCDKDLAKYFVYIGFEDTWMYKSLSDDEKEIVENIKINYRIKK